MKRLLTLARQGWLAVAIGLIGALLLSHWSVCEQNDRYCAFTGSPQ